jgi:hypothetical protein
VLEHPSQSGLEALHRLGPATGPDTSEHAGRHVRLNQLGRDAVHGLLERRDLDQDVVAALVLREHPLDATDLTFQAGEPVLEGLLVLFRQVQALEHRELGDSSIMSGANAGLQ